MAIKPYNGNDKLFLTACSLATHCRAKLAVTHRQYRKWERGIGSAYAKRGEARKLLNPDNVQGIGV